MQLIFQVTVVERAKEAWLYIETKEGHELLAVFESVRSLFERWDVEAEPRLDVLIVWEHQRCPWQDGRSSADPEHVMGARVPS